MKKQVALLGGGDWADASCDLIEIDNEANLDELAKLYRIWINNDYYPYFEQKPRPKFYTFAEWLREFHGATDSTVEEFEH